MKQDKPTPEEVAGEARQGARQWLPRPLTLAFAAAALMIAATLGIFLWSAERPTAGTGAGTGTVDIGGPFELVDHTGRTVTQADFAGKYMLVYFGFTYCADVCPAELQVMSSALDSLGDKARQVQPLFISIDPERDTPENMAAYVEHFHERLVGLTGTPEQIREAATAYKVYYKKVQGSGGADYLMDHTDIVYLMDPDGRYASHFNRSTSAEEMAQGIADVMLRRGS